MTDADLYEVTFLAWVMLLVLLPGSSWFRAMKGVIFAAIGTEAIFLVMVLLGNAVNSSGNLFLVVWLLLAVAAGVGCQVYYARELFLGWESYDIGEKIRYSVLSLTIPLLAAVLGGVAVLVGILLIVGALTSGKLPGQLGARRVWRPNFGSYWGEQSVVDGADGRPLWVGDEQVHYGFDGRPTYVGNREIMYGNDGRPAWIGKDRVVFDANGVIPRWVGDQQVAP